MSCETTQAIYKLFGMNTQCPPKNPDKPQLTCMLKQGVSDPDGQGKTTCSYGDANTCGGDEYPSCEMRLPDTTQGTCELFDLMTYVTTQQNQDNKLVTCANKLSTKYSKGFDSSLLLYIILLWIGIILI